MSEELEKRIAALEDNQKVLKGAIEAVATRLNQVMIGLGLVIGNQKDGSFIVGLNDNVPDPQQGILTKAWLMVNEHEKQLSDKKVVLAQGVGLGINRRN